jgi:NTE family protein
LRRQDVFPLSPLGGFLGYYGLRDSLVTPTALRSLLAQHLPLNRIEEAKTPVHLVATDVLTGGEVLLSQGDAVEAVLASAAIPPCSRRW